MNPTKKAARLALQAEHAATIQAVQDWQDRVLPARVSWSGSRSRERAEFRWGRWRNGYLPDWAGDEATKADLVRLAFLVLGEEATTRQVLDLLPGQGLTRATVQQVRRSALLPPAVFVRLVRLLDDAGL